MDFAGLPKGHDRLDKITNTRGVEYDFQWSGTPARVTAIVTSRPAVSGAPTYQTGFQYDTGGRLIRVLQPKRPFRYDLDHDGVYETGESFDACPAEAFTYGIIVVNSATKYRITDVHREAWTWSGGSNYGSLAEYSETTLTMSYGSTSGDWWRMNSQVEFSGTSVSRTHSYTYVDEDRKCTWTDPLGVARTYEWTEWPGVSSWEDHPALKRNVIRITRTPSASNPRPSNDPGYHGPLAWKMTWEGLRMTTIVGPYAVTAPGQDPPGTAFSTMYDYDTAGRGLITAVTVKGEGTTSTLQRSWTYENWGYPWEGATAKRKASRLKSYTNALGKTWDFTFDTSLLKTTVQYPLVVGDTSRMTATVEEDAVGRVTCRTEPAFDATVTTSGSSTTLTGTSYGKTNFTYESTTSSPSYGLLTCVRRYRGLSETLPVDVKYEYGGVGLLQKVTTAENESSEKREIGIVCDTAMQVKRLYLPNPSTGLIPSTFLQSNDTNWSAEFERDYSGDVVHAARKAKKADGSAYTKSTIESWIWYDRFHRPIKTAGDRAAMTQSSVDLLVKEAVWDAADRLTRIKGPMYSGNAVAEFEFVHDDHGYLYKTKKLLTSGNWSEEKSAFTRFGAIKQIDDPTGYLVKFTSDAFGRVTEALLEGANPSDVDDRKRVITLDSEGNVTKSEFKDGSTLLRERLFTVDAVSRLTTIRTYDGQSNRMAWVEYGFTGLGRVATIRDKEAASIGLGTRGLNVDYDPIGRVAAVEDTLSVSHGNRIQVVRNASGEVIERWVRRMRESATGTIDSTWKRTDYTFDRRGRLAESAKRSNLTQVVAKQAYTYDFLDRLVERKERQLDASSQWQDGKKWTWAYDALGRPLSETISPRSGASESPVLLQLAYTDIPLDQGQLHATWGSVVTRSDGRGNDTSYHYDRAGRLVERRVPGYSGPANSFRWLFEYDDAGRLTAWVDGNNARVEITLDDTTKRPESRQVVSGYSHLSFMTTWEDRTYDQFDRTTAARTRYITFNSGSASTLVTATAAWDAIGRIQNEAFEWRGVSNPAPAIVTSSWDVGGGSLDPAYRQGITTASGWELQYDRDNDGRLTSMRLKSPLTGATLTGLARYWYEGWRALGRDVATTTGTSNFLRDTYTFDGLDQLTRAKTTWQGGSTVLSDDQLVRDWLGNVLSIQYTEGSSSTVEAGDWFDLDGFWRLKEAKLGVDPADFANPNMTYANASYNDRKIVWALDSAHNRTTVTVTPAGGSPTPTYYTVSSDSNRYTAVGGQNFTFDGNGNLVFDGTYLYKYDYVNRLCEVYLYVPSSAQSASKQAPSLSLSSARSILAAAAKRYKDIDPTKPSVVAVAKSAQTSTTTDSALLLAYYGYDPHGRRVIEYIHSEINSYWTAWDGWRRTDEYEDNGSTFTKYRAFFDGGGIDEHLGYAVTSDNGTSWTRYTYLQGYLNQIRGVVNASGTVVERYEYDPYGNRRVYDGSGSLLTSGSAVHNDYGYTGRRHDRVAGLMYYRYRHYHPELGRFLTYDPLGIWGDAAEWGNGYGYAGSSPTNATDSFGLFVVAIVNTQGGYFGNAVSLGNVLDAMRLDPEGGGAIVTHPDYDSKKVTPVAKVARRAMNRVYSEAIDHEFGPGGLPENITPPSPLNPPFPDPFPPGVPIIRPPSAPGYYPFRRVQAIYAGHGSPRGEISKCERNIHDRYLDALIRTITSLRGGSYRIVIDSCFGAKNGTAQAALDKLRALPEDTPLGKAVAEGNVTVVAGEGELTSRTGENGQVDLIPAGNYPGNIVEWSGPGLNTRSVVPNR